MNDRTHAPTPLTALKKEHIVDPHGWTVAQCYGDYAEEYGNLIIAAVNSHAELLAAAKHVIAAVSESPNRGTREAFETLTNAIAKAEKAMS